MFFDRVKPMHNSQFTMHNSQFTIHNSQFTMHNSQFIIKKDLTRKKKRRFFTSFRMKHF